MSFKIRPNHERIFSSTPAQPTEDLVEENVFVVDETTGEIVEEKQMVPRDPVTNPKVPPTPPKDNKFIGLAMRKNTKVSFM